MSGCILALVEESAHRAGGRSGSAGSRLAPRARTRLRDAQGFLGLAMRRSRTDARLAICLSFQTLLGTFQQSLGFGQLLRGTVGSTGIDRGFDRLTGVAHFLDRGSGNTSSQTH